MEVRVCKSRDVRPFVTAISVNYERAIPENTEISEPKRIHSGFPGPTKE
jgi:hypothetical protein